MRRGGGFTWRGCSFRIGLESATILLQNSFRLATIFATIVTRSRHDRATIGRRSWYWWVVDSRPIPWKRFHAEISTIPARSCRHRGSIGPRSWSSSTCLRSCLIALVGWTFAIPWFTAPRSWGETIASRLIGEKIAIKITTVRWRWRSRSSRLSDHDRTASTKRWILTLLVTPRGELGAVWCSLLKLQIKHVRWWMIAWTRVHAIDGFRWDPTPTVWPRDVSFSCVVKHKDDGQTKFIKLNSQRQDIIIKYWVSIGSIHREQGWL